VLSREGEQVVATTDLMQVFLACRWAELSHFQQGATGLDTEPRVGPGGATSSFVAIIERNRERCVA
jgi:hypothetical protein